jgi:hypothetical protein
MVGNKVNFLFGHAFVGIVFVAGDFIETFWCLLDLNWLFESRSGERGELMTEGTECSVMELPYSTYRYQ